jgi:type III restriction enzyme
MSQNMKFQFSHQDFQTRAVEAVVKIFDGQPLATGDFSLMANNSSVSYAADGSIGNELKLSNEQFLTNLQAVQVKNFSDANGSVDSKIFCNE